MCVFLEAGKGPKEPGDVMGYSADYKSFVTAVIALFQLTLITTPLARHNIPFINE